MTKIIEGTNPVFTNLKCCKVSFLIKIKYYYSSHYNDILSYILITIESSTSKKNITNRIGSFVVPFLYVMSTIQVQECMQWTHTHRTHRISRLKFQILKPTFWA